MSIYKSSQTFTRMLCAMSLTCLTVSVNASARTSGGGITNPLAGNSVVQQSRKCSGTVKDKNGEPVIGATIVEKGNAKNGVVTDVDGNFTINVRPGAKLVISYVGSVPQEVTAGQGLNITLQEEDQSLNEVVVVGYGTQKKVNVTGAIATVGGNELAKTPTANLTNTLGGKLAGLRSVTRSGEPGADASSIDIRGYGSALVIVDGVPSSIERLDPNDIESVTVLKDASAAIYGIQAANGVILVTTKRGSSGKAQIELNTTFSYQRPTIYPKLASAAEFVELTDEDLVNRGIAPNYGAEELKKWQEGGPGYEGTDWYDLVTRPWAPQQQYNVNAHGGNDRIRYFGSLGYLKQGGLWSKNSTNYEKFNFRSNVDFKITDRLTAQMSVSGEKGHRMRSIWDVSMTMASIFQTHPTFYPYANNNPNYYAMTNIQPRNALAVTDIDYEGYNKWERKRFEGSASLKYDFKYVKGLSLKGMGYYRSESNFSKNFQKKYNYYAYNKKNDTYDVVFTGNNPSKLTNSFWDRNNWLLQASLNYENSFAEKHNVKVLLLTETTQTKYKDMSAYREFTIDAIDELNSGVDKNKSNSGGSSEMGRVSYVGRINYDYISRYLLEASFRYDGSSYYAPHHRWGFFPSVSAGWRISEEHFMASTRKVIDNLKFRVSYGRLGDDDPNVVAPYQYLTGYTYPSGNYMFGDDLTSGLVPKGLANKDITWYTSDIYNAGIDYDLWHGLLSGTVEFFYRKRTGILATRASQLPTTFGASLPQENLNSDSNRGFELTFTHHNKVSDFVYDISANFSYTRAKYNHIERAASINSFDNWRNNLNDRWKNMWWGYKCIGQFQSMEEIATSPVQDGNGNLTLVPGDLKYEDYNQDGVIDDKDVHVIGRGTEPEIMFGFTLNAAWKGFDMTAFFQGAANFNSYLSDETGSPLVNGSNSFAAFMDRWHHENIYDTSSPWVPGKYPSTYASGKPNNLKTNSFFLQNASYLRLKEFQLGYTIPRDITMKAGIESVRVFFSAYNILTFTGMDMLDPEATSSIRGRYYPQQKMLSFGFNIKL